MVWLSLVLIGTYCTFQPDISKVIKGYEMPANPIRILPVFLFSICFIFGAIPVSAEVAVILSRDDFEPYQEARQGFEETCTAPTKVFAFEVENRETRQYKQRSIDEALNYIQKGNPELICAIGTQAFLAVLQVAPAQIPIVAAMVKSPEQLIQDSLATGHTIYAVDFFVSSDIVMETIRSTYPELKSIGIIYYETSQSLVDELRAEADTRNLQVIAEVADGNNPLPALRNVSTSADLFLIIDNAMIGGSAFDVLLGFQKPIISLIHNPRMVRKGALFGFLLQSRENGRAVGQIANTILAGGKVTPPFPKMTKAALAVNQKVRDLLNVPVPNNFDILEKYNTIE
ncbi:MAG: hypothetical protein D6675_09380 [Gemmatimonadetes bacterium]|nr:MAG: hypothetical protein D6675_09380 [Gemmatimonadota bacterium]